MTVLVPGHHLYAADDGAWRMALPRERFVRLTGDAATLTAFQRRVHGAAEQDDAHRDADPEALDQLEELFASQDLLHARPVPAAGPALRTVHVEAAAGNPIGQVVAELLDGDAHVLRGPLDEDAVAAADVVISCAGWLPDRRWRELDRWCAAYGTAWHRVHAEDVRFFLGPLTVPGSTVGYEDLRGRRIAASGMADEVLRHWAYLEDPAQPTPPVPWPGAAGLAVLAGLVAHDVRTYLATGTPAVVDAEVEVDLASSRITHHRVLALPPVGRDPHA